jgi:hypothetical protein
VRVGLLLDCYTLDKIRKLSKIIEKDLNCEDFNHSQLISKKGITRLSKMFRIWTLLEHKKILRS